MKFMGLICFLLACLIFISQSDAAVVDFKIHEQFVSPRVMGMGGAFSAVADDHTALFYNPAGLARREDGRVNLYLLKGTIGGDILGLMKNVGDASEGASPVDAIGNVLQELYGSSYHGRISMLGGFWVRPNWGIAFIPFDTSLDMYIRRQMGPQINLVARQDSTLVYGWGRDFDWFGKHRFSLGASAKVLNRFYYGDGLQGMDLADDSNIMKTSDMSEGLTADIDVGTLFTPRLPTEGWLSWFRLAKPTFSLVVRNLVDHGYLANLHMASPDSKSPPKLGRRIDIGSSWEYPAFWGLFQARGVMDIRNIGHENWSFFKGFHLGAELLWEVGSWLKGSYSLGLNQGYLTAGLAGHFIWFHLDLVTYGEEVGTSAIRKENRNWMLKMSMDF